MGEAEEVPGRPGGEDGCSQSAKQNGGRHGGVSSGSPSRRQRLETVSVSSP